MSHLGHPGRAGGFTLLEVLVTVVVISIGLLGLLRLQTVSLFNTQISSARSRATLAADDITARIEANASAAADKDYVYDSPYPNQPKPDAPDTDCSNHKHCQPAQMAAFDLWQWDHSLGDESKTAHGLPNGRGYVECTDTDSDNHCRQYRITVAWAERQRDDTDSDTPGSDLCPDEPKISDRCFRTTVQP